MVTIDLISLPHDQGPSSAEAMIVLHDVAKRIYRSKRTAVLTGAGISCNAGIPDFRSSGGLYDMAKEKHPQLLVKGQDLFDISLFRDELSLSLFCTFMESLYQSSLAARPTETHRFIKMLKDKKKLLRCYTQNIDALERDIDMKTGIDISEFGLPRSFGQTWRNLDVVQLHGNLHKLSCTMCYATFDWTTVYQKQLASGLNPQCSLCEAKHLQRLYSGKRITGSVGVLRPDIVLYGENHPQADILAQGINVDIRLKPDLLIVMGTSLRVDGVKKLVRSMSQSVHAQGGKTIFVNKTPLSKAWDKYIDYQILSDCDEFVRYMKREIPDLFLTQEELDSMCPSTKPVTLKSKSAVILENICVKMEKTPCSLQHILHKTPEADFKTEICSQVVKLECDQVKTEPCLSNSLGKRNTHTNTNICVPCVRKEPTANTRVGHVEKENIYSKALLIPSLPLSDVADTGDNTVRIKPAKSLCPISGMLNPTIVCESNAEGKKTIITPPNTPTKRQRPALKRKAPGSTIPVKRHKSAELATPQSSIGDTSKG